MRNTLFSSITISSRSSLHRPPLNSFKRTFYTRTITQTPLTTRFINASKLTALLIALAGGSVYLSDTRAGVHAWLGVPLIRALASQDPEQSHTLAIRLLKFIGAHGLITDGGIDGDQLAVELWGKRFSNPIGIAAGFDKHADAIDGLFDIGFGYVEVGSVTPEPQPGNPQPRMFRLPSTNSIINRYGFNSDGHLAVMTKLRNRVLSFLNQHPYLAPTLSLDSYARAQLVGSLTTPLSSETLKTSPFTPLGARENELVPLDDRLGGLMEQLNLPRSLREGKVLGVNLGKNKTSAPDSIEDFVMGVQRFGPLADVLIVNVSSPNTPGLRSLQSKAIFQELLFEMVKCRDALADGQRPALLVKVAPDLSYQELLDIGQVAREAQIDGIIVSNTTVTRPRAAGSDPLLNETGGLSGPPLKPLALRALSTIYTATEGKLPLIGCGGIASGEDALEYAKAGASLVQLYTSLVYAGIGLPRQIKEEVKTLLGGQRWSEVVGSEAQRYTQDALEHGLEEAKDELNLIEGRLEAYVNRSRRTPGPSPATTVQAEFAAPRSQSSSSGTVKESVTSSSSTGELMVVEEVPAGSEKIRLPPRREEVNQVSDSPRGILADWQAQRRRQIESGDCKRVV